MTLFHTDGEDLKSLDPFNGTVVDRRIVLTPVQESKYPTARALAAAFWASYFALHWLLILEIVEMSVRAGIVLVLHFVLATLLSISIAAHEEKKK